MFKNIGNSWGVGGGGVLPDPLERKFLGGWGAKQKGFRGEGGGGGLWIFSGTTQCLFAKGCLIINEWKILQILFSLLCIKYIFSFGLIEVMDSKGILNTLKKVLCQLWNGLMLQLFLLL